MNRYWDLTEQQRSALTTDEVEAFLIVERMEQGIAPLEPPVLVEVPDVNPPRTTFYGIEYDGRYGRTTFDCVFRTAEEALAFIALKPLAADTDYRIGDEFKFVKPQQVYKIETIQLCEQQDVINLHATLEKRKAALESNRKMTAEYEEACKLATRAVEGVWDDWRECCAKDRGNQRIIDVYQQYVKTCDGDSVIALRFLRKAYQPEAIKAAFAWFGGTVSEEQPVLAAAE